MFQGLSLDQAPPYHIPLRFYITAAVYLVVFAFFSIFFPFLETRYHYETIALTHLLTLGFFSHIMVGSMFQMIPVMLGVAYKNVLKRANIIYIFLNVGILGFVGGFMTNTMPLSHMGGSSLVVGIVFFSVISILSVLKSAQKDFLVLNFLAAFVFLFVGALFGFFALLGHSGIVDSIAFGDIHMAFMFFGWVFLLINAISYKIIPMFFVAKEFPVWIKNYFYIFLGGLLLLFVAARLTQSRTMVLTIEILFALSVFIFAGFSVYLLKNRKRARRDVSVDLWYFSMFNISIAVFLLVFDQFYMFSAWKLVAFFGFFGGLYALINAMLYKIVPFLTWFHLSSNMVFDAEMNDVIKKQQMYKQVKLYFVSYGLFCIGFFVQYIGVLAGVTFVVSSLMLLKNLYDASLYYKEYIKKKIDMGDFA